MEVVVAMAVLSIVLVGFLPVFISASKLNTNSKQEFEAQQFGQYELEMVLLTATQGSMENYKQNPETLFLQYQTVIGDDRFSGQTYKKLNPDYSDFGLYLEYEFPSSDEKVKPVSKVIVSVYEKDILRYQTQDWIRYE